jgi:mono/diheme cytochrome c family protein
MTLRTGVLGAVLVAVAAIHAGVPVAGQTSGVTFSETIAPIVYENCVTCHRPGEAAPFSLITYDDMRRRGKLLVSVTQQRLMPPWQATHGYGDFEGERRLTDQQIAAIAAWVSAGMPQGDMAKAPPLPTFPEGWHLGTPDLVLKMPDPFDVAASGPDIFRNFVIPSGLTEDKWVRAVEFRPSARAVVHHALFAYVPGGSLRAADRADGRPGFRGLAPIGLTGRGGAGSALGGWAVGATPRFLPDGQALPIARNADVVLQMHFHPTGKPEREQATIGLYFANSPPERRMVNLQLPGLFGVGAGIDIPT